MVEGSRGTIHQRTCLLTWLSVDVLRVFNTRCKLLDYARHFYTSSKDAFSVLHVQDFELDAMWCVCVVTTDTNTLPLLQVSFELLASFDMF